MTVALQFSFRVSLSQVGPPGWRFAPAPARAALRLALVAFCLEEKDADLALGIGADGEALAPLKARTRENRRSAMGPADPNAPPLVPAHGLSRTRALLAGKPSGKDAAVFYWRQDRKTGASWGQVLDYHRKGEGPLPSRDVFGLSPARLAIVRARLAAWWPLYLAGAVPVPVAAKPVPLPSPAPPFLFKAVPKYAPKFPELAVAKNPRHVSQVEINGRIKTFGVGIGGDGSAAFLKRVIANGTFSGFTKYDPRTGLPIPKGPPPPPPAPRPKPPAPLPKFGPTAGADFTTASDGDFKAVVSAVFGREVEREELATLAGSPDGSEVFLYGSAKRGKVEIGWDSPTAHAARTFRREGGSLVVHNDIFKVKESARRKGAGAASFGRQVEAARAAGAAKIETYARRDDNMVGYKVWPRFGYDAPLPPDVIERLPESLAKAARLSDLMATEEGRLWWDENGRGLLMTFDLTPGSLSLTTWEEYLRAKATNRTSRTATSR